MQYTTGTWSGLPNYSCTSCPYQTLDEAEMITHILERHTPRPEQPETKADPESAEAEIPGGTDLPVLLVTPEQLTQLTKPRKRARKEK